MEKSEIRGCRSPDGVEMGEDWSTSLRRFQPGGIGLVVANACLFGRAIYLASRGGGRLGEREKRSLWALLYLEMALSCLVTTLGFIKWLWKPYFFRVQRGRVPPLRPPVESTVRLGTGVSRADRLLSMPLITTAAVGVAVVHFVRLALFLFDSDR